MLITKVFLVLLYMVLFGTRISASHYREDVEDNEFAEFEDFEEDDEEQIPKEPQDQAYTPKAKKNTEETEYDDEENVEDEDNEFDHFQDEEEFEGFDSDRIGTGGKLDEKEAPKITITKVPLHFRTNWDSYYLEMLMIAGLIVYALNFFTGKNKNSKLANAWFTTHKAFLEENFSLVGDDGKLENENPGLVKDSENLYTLWCSGRTCCEGMLVELKFLKRQDLVAVIANMMRPSCDQVHIKVFMNKEHMDNVVMCVATKKTAMHMSKDMADLSIYCPERRSVEKYGLPPNFMLLCEIVEVASSMLDSRVVSAISKYSDLIDYIHFSDQFSGPKQPEDTAMTKLPETKKVLMFGFNVQLKGKPMNEVMEQMRPLLQLVFYSMEKVKRFRLSKEAELYKTGGGTFNRKLDVDGERLLSKLKVQFACQDNLTNSDRQYKVFQGNEQEADVNEKSLVEVLLNDAVHLESVPQPPLIAAHCTQLLGTLSWLLLVPR